MPDEIVEVSILPDGKVEIHIKGAVGDSCLVLTAGIEALLGEVEERNLTDEYFEQSKTEERKHIKG